MDDRTREIMALIRSEVDKDCEKQLWSTSDNKVISPEEYAEALQKMASKYPFQPPTIVCDETNNTPEDAAKGILSVTVTLPLHLEKIMLENLGLTNEN